MYSKRPLLYVQISRQIMDDIRAGHYKHALPKEQELAAIYGVGRSTIRSALQELRNDGVLYTLHGKGTFVENVDDYMCMRLDKFRGFYQLIQDAGHVPAMINLSLTESRGLKTDYNLPDYFFQESVYILKRLLQADSTPAVCLREYIPKRHLKTTTLDTAPTSIYSIVKDQVKCDIVYTMSEIIAAMPLPRVGKLFRMSRPAPLIMLKERHSDLRNDTLIYSEAWINNIPSIRLGVLRRD